MKFNIPLKLVVVAFVVFLSYLSVNLWAEKKEIVEITDQIFLTTPETISQMATRLKFTDVEVQKLFGQTLQELETQMVNADSQLEQKIRSALALKNEHSTKNWFKIPLKFALWLVFITVFAFLVTKNRLKNLSRSLMYLLSVIVFGVILGADPSPMGTVKDAIVLFGEYKVIFPPRMVALTIFLLSVIIFNKSICSFGCQFGTLQDLFFSKVKKKIKIPFLITNTIRVLFFITLIVLAFVIPYDLFHEIDPFKIFKPQFLTTIGVIFLAVMLVLSFYIYRPFCHLFCPFGLVGWVFEKLSLFHIRVNYQTCIDCKACTKACPSTVMSAILEQDKIVVPDCFSCGRCVEVCPNGSVEFTTKRRVKKDANV